MSLHESVQYQSIFNQAISFLYALYWTYIYIEYICICRYTFIRTQRRHHPTSCRNSTLVKSRTQSTSSMDPPNSPRDGFLQFTSRRTSVWPKLLSVFFRFPRNKYDSCIQKRFGWDRFKIFLPTKVYRKVSSFHPVVWGLKKIPSKVSDVKTWPFVSWHFAGIEFQTPLHIRDTPWSQ